MTAKLKVEEWSVGKLQPYSKNPRVHPKEQIASLMASILEFGFTSPILVVGKVIVAGHGRLAAAKKLKLTKVPVIKLDGLDDEQRVMAYTIADNKIPMGAEWDIKKLNRMLTSLQKGGFNVGLTGFSDDDMSRLLDDVAQQKLAGVAGEEEDERTRLAGTGAARESTAEFVSIPIMVTPDQRVKILEVVGLHAKEEDMTRGDALYDLLCNYE